MDGLQINKQPLSKEQLYDLFDTGNLPDFIVNRPCYISDDLRNFYVGVTRTFYRNKLGERIDRYIIKRVILQTPIFYLPVRKGNRVITNWKVGNYKLSRKPLVIILSVSEYSPNRNSKLSLDYNLIGIFPVDTFQERLVQADRTLNDINYPFEDFSPLSPNQRTSSDMDYITTLTNINKFKKTQGRVSVNQPTKEDLLRKMGEEMAESTGTSINSQEAKEESEEVVERIDYLGLLNESNIGGEDDIEYTDQNEPSYYDIQTDEGEDEEEEVFSTHISDEDLESLPREVTDSEIESVVGNLIEETSKVKANKINKIIDETVVDEYEDFNSAKDPREQEEQEEPKEEVERKPIKIQTDIELMGITDDFEAEV